MSFEKISILETNDFSAGEQYKLPHRHSCEVCSFTSLQGFEECPRCIVSEDEIETAEEISGTGIWLIILGCFYGIISLVVVLNSGGKIEFFEKASETDFLSVSHFAALFALPIIFISTGVITFIRKKDNWKGRLIITGIIAVALFTLDQIFMTFF